MSLEELMKWAGEIDESSDEKEILRLINNSLASGMTRALQQKRTPPWIVKKIIGLLQIPMGATVFDPCCGEGTILKQMPNESNVSGIEIDENLFKLARDSMPLAKITHDDTANHLIRDYESDQYAKKPLAFDYVFCHPPLGITLINEDEQITSFGSKIISHQAFITFSRLFTIENGIFVLFLPRNFFRDYGINGTDFSDDLINYVRGVRFSFVDEYNDHMEAWICFRSRYAVDAVHKVMPIEILPSSDITDLMKKFENQHKLFDKIYSHQAGIKGQRTEFFRKIKVIGDYSQTTIPDRSTAYMTIDSDNRVKFVTKDDLSDMKLRLMNSVTSNYIEIFNDFNKLVDFKNDPDNFEGTWIFKKHGLEIILSPEVKKELDKIVSKAEIDRTPFGQWIDREKKLEFSETNANTNVMTKFPEVFESYMKKIEEYSKSPRYDYNDPYEEDKTKRKKNFFRELFEYQKKDACRVAMKDTSILALYQGVGKSRTAIAAGILKGGKKLICCPSKLIPNWLNEFEENGLELPYIIEYEEDVKGIKDHEFCIISFTKLRTMKGKKGYVIPAGKKNKTKEERDALYRKKAGEDEPTEEESEEESVDEPEEEEPSKKPRKNPDPEIEPPIRQNRERKDENQEIQTLKEKETIATLLTRKFDWVIIDEAHLISSPTSGVSIATRQLEPKGYIFLTGTPIRNKVSNFFTILDIGWKRNTPALPFETLEDYKGKFSTFIENESKAGKIETPTVQNPDQFILMMEPKWIRRLKYEPEVQEALATKGMRFIPPNVISDSRTLVTPDKNQYEFASLWYDVLMKFKEELKTLSDREAQQLTLAIIQKLRQCSTSPQGVEIFEEDLDDEAITKSGFVKKLREISSKKGWSSTLEKALKLKWDHGRSKLQKTIIEEAKKRIKSDKRGFLVTTFLANVNFLVEEMEKEGLTPVKFTGREPVPKRKVIIENYKKGRYDIIIATIGVMDVGLNLPEADFCIIANPEFEYSSLEQAWSRMLRPKSVGEKDVLIYRNSKMIDEYLWRIAEMKKNSTDVVLDRCIVGNAPSYIPLDKQIDEILKSR